MALFLVFKAHRDSQRQVLTSAFFYGVLYPAKSQTTKLSRNIYHSLKAMFKPVFWNKNCNTCGEVTGAECCLMKTLLFYVAVGAIQA